MPDAATKIRKLGKPKKNQDILDFIDWTKNQLGDQNPKDYGLYMKLYKQFGKTAILKAVTATIRKQDLKNKLPYFIAVIYRRRKELGMRKEKRAQPIIEGERAQAARAKYERMLKILKKKTTPAYQQRGRSRSAMLHAVAKQERRQNAQRTA